ncbi:splicing factor, arginine/serine-rich 19-like [Porites lutea]|uniref:splicing factor, arginine/serine-rich 19-like n=1 Tax=Porites lutea TaxID=51062 RepID=UPI003CC5A9C9
MAFVGDKLSKRGQDEKVPGTNGDRDQQRKLGIARLQRHHQIVGEVKLALKPFYRQGKITKDDYKLIMKKRVEKIEESKSSVDRDRVGRLVKKYVQRIKGVEIAIPP